MGTMAAAPSSTYYTPEDVEAMGDAAGGYELIDGCLVERHMGSKSSEIGAIIVRRLGNHLEGKGTGRVYSSDLALHMYPDRPQNFRRADASFIRRERLPDGQSLEGDPYFAPDLAVEVISPNDNAVQVERKVRDYLANGVRMVWVVYPETRTVHVYRPGGTSVVLADTDDISGEDVIPGFACRVADFFPED